MLDPHFEHGIAGHDGPGHPSGSSTRPAGSAPTTSSAASSTRRAITTGTGSSSSPAATCSRLSGTGDDPVGDPLLVLRDEDGPSIDRNDNSYRGSGANRASSSRSPASPQDLLSRRQRQRPLHRPARGWRSRAQGGPRDRRLRPGGQPARRLAARRDRRRQWLEEARHRRLLRAGGQDRRDLRRRAAPIESAGWNAYQVRRAMAALDAFSDVCDLSFRQTHRRSRRPTSTSCSTTTREPRLQRSASSPPEPSAKAPASSPRPEGRRRQRLGDPARAEASNAARLGWELMLHEFGHALGLAHPHDVGFGSVVMDGVRRRTGRTIRRAGRLRPELDALHA